MLRNNHKIRNYKSPAIANHLVARTTELARRLRYNSRAHTKLAARGKGGQKLCILRPLRLDTPPFRCPRRLPAFDYSFLHSISFFSSRQPSSSRPLFHFSLLVPSNVVHRKTIAQYKRYNPEFQYRAFSRRQNCAATV